MSHLLSQGMSTSQVKATARVLLDTVDLLNLRESRQVHPRELAEAGSRWAADHEMRRGKRPSEKSCQRFVGIASKWLTFIGLLREPDVPRLAFDFLVKSYLENSRLDGVAECTMYQRRIQLSNFQQWLGDRIENFAELSLNHIDEYVNSRRTRGWGRTTLQINCYTIRLFLRYCESRNWCRKGIARGILIPSRVKADVSPRGPTWRDVRRMLKIRGTTPTNIRARAIISLCAIYGLRRSEVVRLRLTDFDWYNEIMTVRRAKCGRIQRFPIQYEVGEAILAYLRRARPRSNCPNLFTGVHPPIRPLDPSRIGDAVRGRMKELDIRSPNFGPHALRHSCATQLLDCGFSLNDIADFLGHRSWRTVSTYAKHNPKLLRSVADFHLSSIQ